MNGVILSELVARLTKAEERLLQIEEKVEHPLMTYTPFNSAAQIRLAKHMAECYRELAELYSVKPSPECEPVDCKTICDTCGEYDYDCECKPYISIPRSVAEAWCKDCMKPVTDYRIYNALRTALKQNGKDQK
jgi:hypothetical protein